MHPAGAKNQAHGMLGKTLETKPHSTLEAEELDTDACWASTGHITWWP